MHSLDSLSEFLKLSLCLVAGWPLEEKQFHVVSGSAGVSYTSIGRDSFNAEPGRTEITPRGEEVLAAHPDRIDLTVLEQFTEFQEFRALKGTQPRKENAPVRSGTTTATADQTAEERLEAAHEELLATLAEDLLSRLVDSDNQFFENVVLDVLVGMGYGGSKREAAERIGRSGDGGIDGVIP